jgi:hypothetical protein
MGKPLTHTQVLVLHLVGVQGRRHGAGQFRTTSYSIRIRATRLLKE